MKKIKIQRDYTLVDDDIYKLLDGVKLSKNNWGYIRLTKTNEYLHRLVAKIKLNDGNDIDKYKVVDHINRNQLDNRVSNLRIVTRSQNQYNHKIKSNNKTGYNNISIHKMNKKILYRVTCSHFGKQHHGGCFSKLKDAVLAREQLRYSLFGTSSSVV